MCIRDSFWTHDGALAVGWLHVRMLCAQFPL